MLKNAAGRIERLHTEDNVRRQSEGRGRQEAQSSERADEKAAYTVWRMYPDVRGEQPRRVHVTESER